MGLLRRAAALLALGLFGCEAVRDPGAERPLAGCPRPCPAACPRACLPSGFCAEADLALSPAGAAGNPDATRAWFHAEGFPPGEALDFSAHLGIDVAELAGRERGYFAVEVHLGEAPGSVTGFNLDGIYPHPLWRDWVASASPTSPDGLVRLVVRLDRCVTEGGAPGHCAAAPGSVLHASLINRSPYSAAPACP